MCVQFAHMPQVRSHSRFKAPSPPKKKYIYPPSPAIFFRLSVVAVLLLGLHFDVAVAVGGIAVATCNPRKKNSEEREMLSHGKMAKGSHRGRSKGSYERGAFRQGELGAAAVKELHCCQRVMLQRRLVCGMVQGTDSRRTSNALFIILYSIIPYTLFDWKIL